MSQPIDALAATATSAGSSPTATSSEPLQQVGRYRVEREIGAGAMGVVYAAHDPELDRRVALKVLRAVSGDARTRLLREARAIAKLSHPAVVTVYEIGTVDNRDYIAMELVEGTSLAEWLNAGTSSLAERVDAMLTAGRGLAAAHAAGMVHRDFKPQNVLRANDGRVLVTDFGLARSSASTDDDAGSVRSGDTKPLAVLTQTGVLVGTPAYMAPEQWNSAAITPATDQFAFCVSLWEAITRKRPFTGSTLDELRTQIERGPATLNMAGIARPFQAILRRGLDPDPAQRWPSMTELLEAIARTRRTRRRGLIIAAMVAVAIAITGFVATRGTADDRDALPTQFTKIVGDRVTAPQAAIDGLIKALRAKSGARFVPLTNRPGFKLFAIRGGSYFDAIGLVNGDVLIAIDGHPVGTKEQLDEVLRGLTSKPKLELEILRVTTKHTLAIQAK